MEYEWGLGIFLSLLDKSDVVYGPHFEKFCYCSLNKLFCLSIVKGEGYGTPLQYSCLENPMDGGAW